MSSGAKQTTATIIPTLRYTDAPAAVEWLCKALVGRWPCSSPVPELRESPVPRAGQGSAKKYRWNLERNSGFEDSAFRAHG